MTLKIFLLVSLPQSSDRPSVLYIQRYKNMIAWKQFRFYGDTHEKAHRDS